MTKRLRQTVVGLAALMLGAGQASAVVVTLNSGDAGGTSSYNTAGNWSNSAAPSAGNTYEVSVQWLRSPGSGNHTFGGDTLTLKTGGAVLSKNGGAQTLTQNLVLDGGFVRSGSGINDPLTLAGTISLTGNGGGLYPDQSPFIITASLSGTGPLTLGNSIGGSGPGRGIDFTGASTMTGNVIANASDMVWTGTSSWQFTIGTSGVNNEIAGTGDATFDGVFTFDLTGASSTPGDSWNIASVATQTFGNNFSVTGFAENAGVWSNGAYSFDTATGVLTAVPEASAFLFGGVACLGVGLGYFRRHRR